PRGPALYGSDYNPDLISWCQGHLTFAQFQVNAIDRPLAYAPASFDLVYALSVFTHLSEPLQRFWIDEMARVIKPGGHLFLTVHGASYLPQLSPDEQSQFQFGDRKSTRLNSSHVSISYAVFCLKKKNKE